MDLTDRSIIYYSACTEPVEFEAKIIADLKEKAGDIPTVSITRKPLDLGTNICVGEVPISYTSEWKQLLIGLKAAKTKYCIAAEADCIYPPEYFTFQPTEERMIYNYNNVYIVWKNHNGFWKKTGYCEGAQMCDREYWIERLEPLLPIKPWTPMGSATHWSEKMIKEMYDYWEPFTRDEENRLVKKIFDERKEFTGRPVVSFKTGSGVSSRTTFVNEKIREIDYWGNISDLKEKYFRKGV